MIWELKQRLTDIKSTDNQWFNDTPTLVDSGGCESGINTSFAYSHMEDMSNLTLSPAISACRGQVFFNKYIEAEVKLGSTDTMKKFYLMENLMVMHLMGFPFLEQTGAVLDARGRIFEIRDYKETIPLRKLEWDKNSKLVFTTFGQKFTVELSCMHGRK